MILGLPLESFLMLIVLPALVLVWMAVHCWKSRKEDQE